MEATARSATAADASVLAELAAEAVAEQREGRGGRTWSAREARALPAASTLAAVIDDPAYLVLAGTIDEVVVGYAVATVEELRTGERLGIVDDVYVDPGGRGVGVGEAMLDLVVAWCEEAGCVGIDALALPGNRATKNFFESFGFTARAIIVHRKLTS